MPRESRSMEATAALAALVAAGRSEGERYHEQQSSKKGLSSTPQISSIPGRSRGLHA